MLKTIAKFIPFFGQNLAGVMRCMCIVIVGSSYHVQYDSNNKTRGGSFLHFYDNSTYLYKQVCAVADAGCWIRRVKPICSPSLVIVLGRKFNGKETQGGELFSDKLNRDDERDIGSSFWRLCGSKNAMTLFMHWKIIGRICSGQTEFRQKLAFIGVCTVST